MNPTSFLENLYNKVKAFVLMVVSHKEQLIAFAAGFAAAVVFMALTH